MSDPSTLPCEAPARTRPNGPSRRNHRRRLPLGSRSGHDRVGRQNRRLGLGPWVRVGVVLFLMVAAIGTPIFLSSSGVRGAPAGAPTLAGYYIVGNGAALVAVGYVGWANIWTSAANGSQVFSGAFYLAFFNLQSYASTIPVDINENGVWVYNGSVTIGPLSQQDVSIPLPEITSWSPTKIYFFGQATWEGWVATPISLLPNYILNVGGLDAFGLTLVSLSLIFMTVGTTLGRWAVRRALWAPKFTALIWFHVILVAIGGVVFLDYPLVDSTFAGWSPFVYPLVLGPMSFLWSLSLFNRAQRVQIQSATLTANNEMGYVITDVRIGRLGKKIVYVGERWGDFWARFFGHHAYAHDGDDRKPKPWFAPAIRGLSPTAGPRERLKAKKAAAKAHPVGADALTKFPVLSAAERDDIAYVAIGKGIEAPEVEFPHLSIHRTVEEKVDAQVVDGVVVKAAEVVKRRKLTWPHYVDPDPTHIPDLEDYHYEVAASVWAKWAAIRDLGRVYSKVAHAFAMLSANVETRVNDEVYAQLRTHYALTGRVSSGISEDEAVRRSGDLSKLLDAKREGNP